MKKLPNKGAIPTGLNDYQQQYPDDRDWEHFRAVRTAYDELKVAVFNEQAHLCAYCECKVPPEEYHRRRIEHFHPKSDLTGSRNWTLDWHNMLGVCHGGSDNENREIFPLPDNLSCDAHKDSMITNSHLLLACEGYLINPLTMNTTECLFSFDKSSGKLLSNDAVCSKVTIPGNKYSTTKELVEKTIEFLNLNCNRLNTARLEVFRFFEKELKKARVARRSPEATFTLWAQRWMSPPWKEYFTTRRILLRDSAETYLQSINYNG